MDVLVSALEICPQSSNKYWHAAIFKIIFGALDDSTVVSVVCGCCNILRATSSESTSKHDWS